MADFAIDVSKFVAKAGGRIDIVLRKIALDLHRGVVEKTPVDTGRARANWNVGVNNVDPSVTTESQKNVSKVRAAAQNLLKRIKAGDTVYVTNNVDYITRLERGSSKQAPAGMVAVTLREYPGIVEKGVRQAKRERP